MNIFKKLYDHFMHMDPTQRLQDGLYTMLGGLSIVYFGQHMESHKQTKLLAPKDGPYYLLYKYVTHYLHNGLVLLEQLLNNPAIAVIVFIIIARMIIMPLSLYVSNHSVVIRERTAILKPQLNLINSTLDFEAVTETQKQKLYALRRKTLQANHMSLARWPFYSLIALQIIIATSLYQSVAYSPELQHATFLGIKLGQTNAGLTISASLMYLLGSIIMALGLTKRERQNMPLTNYWLVPVSTFCSGSFLPSIISLYWLVSATIIALKDFISYFILRPYTRKRQHEIWQPVTVVTQDKIDEIMKTNSSNQQKENNLKINLKMHELPKESGDNS